MSSQLKLTDITKKFEANTVNEKVALDHLNLTVEPGQFVTVLGSNGSGKSTMFNVILGSLFPDEGKVYLGDKDITKLKQSQLRDVYGNIHMVFQNPTGSFDPRRTLGDGIGESLRNRGMKKADIAIRVKERSGSFHARIHAQIRRWLKDIHMRSVEDSARELQLQGHWP